MRVDSKGPVQFCNLDDRDSGEGLAIFFSQDGASEVRWRVLVKAKIDQGVYDMGEFFISPPVVTAAPAGRLSRMVAMAVCPGAIGWSLEINAVPGFDEDISDLPEEVADIILASSKCCTAPGGVSRVGERYGYVAGTAISPTITNYPVPAGQKITGIAAIGGTGGGSFTINGGSTMLVNDGISVNFEPMAPIPPNAVIAFDNVIFAIEFLESA